MNLYLEWLFSAFIYLLNSSPDYHWRFSAFQCPTPKYTDIRAAGSATWLKSPLLAIVVQLYICPYDQLKSFWNLNHSVYFFVSYNAIEIPPTSRFWTCSNMIKHVQKKLFILFPPLPVRTIWADMIILKYSLYNMWDQIYNHWASFSFWPQERPDNVNIRACGACNDEPTPAFDQNFSI